MVLFLDMYSFHRDEECARRVYDQVCDAYERIYDKLELNCYKGWNSIFCNLRNLIWFSCSVPADSGLMGGSLNHEFLAVSSAGEDSILVCSKYVIS